MLQDELAERARAECTCFFLENSMMTGTYQGWTNYATWNVALWIDNDEPMYLRKIDWIRRFSGRIDARLAEEIAEDCLGGRTTPDMEGKAGEGLAWKDVDWNQIAEHWSDEGVEPAEG